MPDRFQIVHRPKAPRDRKAQYEDESEAIAAFLDVLNEVDNPEDYHLVRVTDAGQVADVAVEDVTQLARERPEGV